MPAQEDLFRTAACSLPRLAVSSLSGGGGKTLLSLGLAGALTERGLEVVPFKKGPDYIDAAWLAAAAGRPSSNLDPFFLSSGRLRSLFVLQASRTASPAALAEGRCLALVEGNRGLYDGMDLEGSCSTAALARDLDAPVLLSLNATKMTRTAAALIQGVMGFEKGLRFAGVVLNQVGRSRHGSYLRACIERYTDMPVLGELPRLAENPLPERQMGIASLLGDRLSETCESALAILKAHVRENVDVDRIVEASRTAGRLEHVAPFWDGVPAAPADPPVIAVVRDASLWFYYRENFEALERAGAKLAFVSLLDGKPWDFDGIDAVYLGGGFPEDYLDALSSSPRLKDLASEARRGLPIYAECGGFMILARTIAKEGRSYPMAGLLPVDIDVFPKPRGLGYVEAVVARENPYHPLGLRLRGHEFHYSTARDAGLEPALVLEKGTGMGQGRDGLALGSVWGSYTHVFAPAVPTWAGRFVDAAKDWKGRRRA
ncbi:MAG: cobyrinate a,c-diamide synthase [Desulfovibrio sp.]|nr:cobyrinate a,c-diamide synthase [Desulfovibrio sp.]